jgi:hypothetical protein
MTELDPEREEDEPAALRSAAVEALQSAARQSDPKESDRLTRHGLALIERARAIGHRRRSGISEADGTTVRNEPRMQEDEGPRHSLTLAAKFIATLWRLRWWRTGR